MGTAQDFLHDSCTYWHSNNSVKSLKKSPLQLQTLHQWLEPLLSK